MSDPQIFSDDDWDDELTVAPQTARSTRPMRIGTDDVFYDQLQAPREFVDKVFAATDDLPIEFIDQADVLCRLSKARAAHWVKVRNAYSDATASHVVLRSYPTSAQKLVNDHAKLRGRQLHGIVSGIVAGLSELEKLLHRPHGNLKSSNVLLRSRRLSAEAVALTDPAPTMRARERGDAHDLRKLGEIIHLLVLRRLPHKGEAWPVPPSREWEALGRNGDRWRDLCSRLIEPGGTALAMENVRRVLRHLGGRGSLAVVWAITATAIVSGAVAGAYVKRDYLHSLVAGSSATPPVAEAFHPKTDGPTSPLVTPPPVSGGPVPVVDAFAVQRAFEGGMSHVRSLASILEADWANWTTARLTAVEQNNVTRFIEQCNQPIAANAPQVAAALEAENHRYADFARRDPARLPPQLAVNRERIIARLLEADRIAKAFPDPAALPKTTTPIGQAVAARLREMCRSINADDIADAIAIARQPGDTLGPSLETLAKKVAEGHAAIEKFLFDVDRVSERLAEGFTPDASPDGQSIQNVIAAWPTSPAYADKGIRAALAPIVSAVNETNAAALRKLALSNDALPGLRLAAWQSPANGTPVNRAELDGDVATRDALLEVAEALQPVRRRDVVSARISAIYAQRWGAFAARAASGQDIASAMEPAIRPADLDASKLAGTARWNVLLFQLRTIATDGRIVVTLPRAQALVAELLKAADDLPPNAARPPQAIQLAATLREWNGVASAPAEDLTQIGPASASVKAMTGSTMRWTADPEPGGATISFRATDGAMASATPEAPLIFRRVASPAGDVYLCTTETPLGLFIDVLTSTNRWREVRESKLLGVANDFGATPRGGPHGWRWSPRPDGGIVKSLVWLPSEWVPSGADDYPDTLGGEFNRATLRNLRGDNAGSVNPSRLQPMQQIPAEAAKYFANLIGCRLPTPDEWKLAYASTTQPTRGANLRDKSWRLELEQMSRVWPRQSNGATGYRPDAEMFVPTGEAFNNDVWKTAGGDEYDDGVLWFREVNTPGADVKEFQNLAGNVGEFVRDPAGKTFVIGGSALSPPSRAIDQPFEVEARDLRRGFADVGFRLAFAAPLKPLERLASILAAKSEGYVSSQGK